MLVLANIQRRNTKGLSQSYPSHRNIYTYMNEHTRIKTTKSYSINWSPFLMSCCLVLLSSDTLDMLSWTSTFRICHSSKRKRDKWLLQYVSVCIWTRRIHSHINTKSIVQKRFCTTLQRPLQKLLTQVKHPQQQREKPQVTTNTPSVSAQLHNISAENLSSNF